MSLLTPLLMSMLVASLAGSCGDAAPMKSIGGPWRIEAGTGYGESVGDRRFLIRMDGGRRLLVDERIEQFRFYEPDCVVYQTARVSHDLFVVCGDRAPVAIESSISADWQLEAAGPRRVLPPVVKDGQLVQRVEEFPVEALRDLARKQPEWRQGMRAEGFDPASAAILPTVVDRLVDFRSAPQSAAPLLIRAAIGDEPEIIDGLLEAGADVNATNDAMMTPLMFAAGNRNGEVVDRLLAAGADVNRQDNEGQTALMLAAGVGEREIVKRLLAAGADRNARDKRGRTAAERIPSSMDRELVALLRGPN
jgi:hypothetical protein